MNPPTHRHTCNAAVVATAFIVLAASAATYTQARELTFGERVKAQQAIEQIYWQHRIWPKENPGPKPPLSAVMPDSAIRAKVEETLRMSALLETFWHQPLTGEQLQAEIDRMVRTTKAPETLREIFAALDNDPFLIAESVARPALAARRVQAAFARDERIHGVQRKALAAKLVGVEELADLARLDGDHAESTIILDKDASAKDSNADPIDHAIHLNGQEWARALSEFAKEGLWGIPLGGVSSLIDRGDRFVVLDVRAKSETSVTIASVSWPKRAYTDWAREQAGSTTLDAGAIVSPQNGYSVSALPLDGCTVDTWTPTSSSGAPHARAEHIAVWTGSETIVWGGLYSDGLTHTRLNTGGRYDPATDTWVPSSLDSGSGANVPSARSRHAAVWTGYEMIVWGGIDSANNYLNTGGRYNPSTDSWAASSLRAGLSANTPAARVNHSAIWTGSEMIVWGGTRAGVYYNNGGRYNPSTDSWVASSLFTGSGENVPSAREYHTAIWTGSEMIVWGGNSLVDTNTGGRYNPSTDLWAASSLTTGSGANVPVVRHRHSAIWTGSEMIVWGGDHDGVDTNTGGRYNPSTDSWADSALLTGSGANVPVGRIFFSAVWTGSGMIVWGGFNIVGYVALNTGGLYDPTTDLWADSSLTTGSGANCPEARYAHITVWTGSEMIVWAGQIPDDVFFQSGGRYCVQPCAPQTWYKDVDGDGHGDPAVTQSSCTQPPGYVASGDDCGPTDPNVYPGGTEICNLIDDNCDGVIDNGSNAMCDDGNVCTAIDVCSGGMCVHVNMPDGTFCHDDDLCTGGETCQAGTCTPTVTGLNEPNPRTTGYYKRLCHGPHSGDQFADADAVCVGQITVTFAGISTVVDLCNVLEPQAEDNDRCGQAEDDLVVLALNICRARVCTAQSIDSQCGGNGDVGQSLAESDGILASPSRDRDACSHAKCLDEEINTGRALELNTLVVNLEGADVRLAWSPPFLDDGTGHPKSYRIWRRPLRSLTPFTNIGQTTDPTFLDATSGSGEFEYEITAVMKGAG